ncbi:hypothetical protein GW17_00052685, partial [Ensete ventricosum]
REAREVRNNTGAVCGDAGRGGFARGRGGRGGEMSQNRDFGNMGVSVEHHGLMMLPMVLEEVKMQTLLG